MTLKIGKSYGRKDGSGTGPLYPFEKPDCGYFYCAAGLAVRLYARDGRCLTAPDGDDSQDIENVDEFA